jgi:hypothetical protein
MLLRFTGKDDPLERFQGVFSVLPENAVIDERRRIEAGQSGRDPVGVRCVELSLSLPNSRMSGIAVQQLWPIRRWHGDIGAWTRHGFGNIQAVRHRFRFIRRRVAVAPQGAEQQVARGKVASCVEDAM